MALKCSSDRGVQSGGLGTLGLGPLKLTFQGRCNLPSRIQVHGLCRKKGDTETPLLGGSLGRGSKLGGTFQFSPTFLKLCWLHSYLVFGKGGERVGEGIMVKYLWEHFIHHLTNS